MKPYNEDKAAYQLPISYYAIDKARLREQGFSKAFTEWEEKRMETHALEQMLRIHTKDDATLKARLKTHIVKDGDCLRLPSYMHVADQYIRLLVRMDVGLKKLPHRHHTLPLGRAEHSTLQ